VQVGNWSKAAGQIVRRFQNRLPAHQEQLRRYNTGARGTIAEMAPSPAAGGQIMARDPVCKMQVDEQKAPKSEYKGREYYFCSLDCKEQFDNNPQRYAEVA
jgi:YHS domain-containing protein